MLMTFRFIAIPSNSIDHLSMLFDSIKYYLCLWLCLSWNKTRSTAALYLLQPSYWKCITGVKEIGVK